MTSFSLNNGESLSFSINGVSHRKGKSGVLSTGLITGELNLTTERILYIPKKVNPFGKEKDWLEIQLDEVVVRGTTVQIEASRPSGRTGGYQISVYSQTSKDDFIFPYGSDKEAMQFVERANEIIIGSLGAYDPQNAGFDASVDKKIAGFVSAAKPIANDLVDIAKPLVGTAAKATVMSAGAKGGLFGKVLGVAEVVADKVITKESPEALPVATASSQNEAPEQDRLAARPSEVGLDDQIEALKKLKELVDADILTQDEFNAKKKQILGL